MENQLDLFNDPYEIHSYDIVVVAFSGGKDSTALVLWLLEHGVSKRKIELHHHLVDGAEGSTLMDWPVTESYCKAFADALGLPIYFSWKEGGFEREMNRNNSETAPMVWESPSGFTHKKGGIGPLGTRKKFPQVSPSLSVRWCSAYLKIDVMSRLINNSDRFKGKRTVVLSGERGEESKARSCYAIQEPDRSDARGPMHKRHVDRLRPIRDWEESEVWAIMERFKIRAHPCYFLGWGRCSCRFCIFGNANQFRSSKEVDPKGFDVLADYESRFGCTIKRKESLPKLASKGTPYNAVSEPSNEYLKRIVMGKEYPLSIVMDEWELPDGAYGESSGPT
jgi:3'-phosphoadenosine 5'-phosphosulfate sulfotransferase (PAPS reductase)/FAD synthetase